MEDAQKNNWNLEERSLSTIEGREEMENRRIKWTKDFERTTKDIDSNTCLIQPLEIRTFSFRK